MLPRVSCKKQLTLESGNAIPQTPHRVDQDGFLRVQPDFRASRTSVWGRWEFNLPELRSPFALLGRNIVRMVAWFAKLGVAKLGFATAVLGKRLEKRYFRSVARLRGSPVAPLFGNAALNCGLSAQMGPSYGGNYLAAAWASISFLRRSSISPCRPRGTWRYARNSMLKVPLP